MKENIIKTWKIEEHPDKDAVYEWIREHWYDLGDYKRKTS